VIEQVQANFTWAKEYLTWENRMGHPNATALGIFDPPMTAKYSGHSTAATGLLACIGFFGVVIFTRLVKKLNRSPEERAAAENKKQASILGKVGGFVSSAADKVGGFASSLVRGGSGRGSGDIPRNPTQQQSQSPETKSLGGRQ
jgi:hypothetical protein